MLDMMCTPSLTPPPPGLVFLVLAPEFQNHEYLNVDRVYGFSFLASVLSTLRRHQGPFQLPAPYPKEVST